MATQLPSSPDVLLLALQARVMASLSLDVSCVPIITDDGDDDASAIAQAETVVFLAPGDGLFDTGQTVAAGRVCVVERLTFQVRLWTRLMLDESTTDAVRLTAPASATPPGHLAQRHGLINALALFQPLDAAGNWIGAEPVKPLRTGRPRKPKDRAGWTRSTVDFLMPYQLDLGQAYQ